MLEQIIHVFSMKKKREEFSVFYETDRVQIVFDAWHVNDGGN